MLHVVVVNIFGCGHVALKRGFVRPSVRPCVRWSVSPSVRRSVRRGDRVGKCENVHFRPCLPVGVSGFVK